MNTVLAYAALTLRLNVRNAMAMIYGYLFPLIFLAAFAVIYRHDPAPVIGHLGELLTVTALGGACFGLPTAIVAERERGVWRRYRATPTGAGTFIAGLVLSRLALLLSAAAIQLAIAIVALGMPLPRDPIGLGLAFIMVSSALIGLGMIVAMLANTVPAVQALGQCIFLPMLMIGGVAVRLSSLPHWVQTLSAFFPGRYAVAAIQATATGGSLGTAAFDLFALAVFTLSAALIAASLFRWDSGRRQPDRRLLAGGLALWLAIGCMGAWMGVDKGRGVVDDAPVAPPAAYLRAPAAPHAGTTPAPDASPAMPADDAGEASPDHSPPALAVGKPRSWRAVTAADIGQIAFERLPDDEGLVSPIAQRGTLDDPAVEQQIAQIRAALPGWLPAQAPEPVQRVRNLLAIAAVPDVLQIDPLERHLPWLVFDRLRLDIPQADLPRILYWISQHPDEGDDSAITQLDALGLPTVSGPATRVRERIMIYALKFLARLPTARDGASGGAGAPVQPCDLGRNAMRASPC